MPRRPLRPSSAADASITDAPNVVCAVSIADCMPVLHCRCIGALCRCRARWVARPCGGCYSGHSRAMRQRLDACPTQSCWRTWARRSARATSKLAAEVLDAMRTQGCLMRRHAFAPAGNGKYLRRSVRARAPGASKARRRTHLWWTRMHVQRPDSVLQLSPRSNHRSPRRADLASLTSTQRRAENPRQGDIRCQLPQLPHRCADAHASRRHRRTTQSRRDNALNWAKHAAAETAATVSSVPATYVLPPSPESADATAAGLSDTIRDAMDRFLSESGQSRRSRSQIHVSADPAWQSNSLASFYARAYLLNSDFMNRLADTVDGDRKTKQRVKYRGVAMGRCGFAIQFSGD